MPGSRLTVVQRVVIQRGVQQGLPQRMIAVLVGVHESTVSRELRRNASPRSHHRGAGAGTYRARKAQRLADWRARRPQPGKLRGELALVVSGLLEADWSPAMVAAMLPRLFPERADWRVSHETIYRSLFVQGRGQLRRELTAHLRTGRPARKPRGVPERRGKLPDMVSISARPAEASDRAVPGSWEGDLLLGGVGKGAVITLVERASRFVILAPLPGRHDAVTVRDALTRMIGRLPLELRKALTWDQGSEMSEHARFTLDTGVPVYFCDPHSPWQRGTNENTNGLLRQYWPKGADLRGLTQADSDTVALRLNTRPRQTLGWDTPAQALNHALLATTA